MWRHCTRQCKSFYKKLELSDKAFQFQTTCDNEFLQYWLYIDTHPQFGFYDIRQNFAISKNGVIEGRGWNTQPQYNSTTSGNFLYVTIIQRVGPDVENQLNETLHRLLEDGFLLGKVVQNPEIVSLTDYSTGPPTEFPTTIPTIDPTAPPTTIG